MTSTVLASSPFVRVQTRRAAPQRTPVVVQSCRPRYSQQSSPFFRMGGMPFMGPEQWSNFQRFAGQQGQQNNTQAWQELFKMAEKAFGPNSSQQWQKAAESAASAWAFPVDIVESETEYVLTADVPGLSKGDLKIRVKEEDRQLIISGERRRAGKAPAADKEAAESKEETSSAFQGKQVYERRMGSFERTFTLSEKADPNAICARVEKGVLTLTILKKERDEPQVKDVPIWD